jgi:Tfp pilus assembly protein PilE
VSSERGSALLLVPAGVLIVALLASIAVDSTAAFLAQREAQAAASSLANDLVSLALDESTLRHHGSYRLDASRLRRLRPWSQRTAQERLSAVFEPGSVSVAISAAGPSAVRVSVEGSARRVIGLIGNVNGQANRPVAAEAVAHVRLSG